jgi:hypothetical protein
MGRDTTTGHVLESMILPALEQGGYLYEKQAVIGQRLGGRKHQVDVLLTAQGGGQIPVSLKWQQVSGTAEQKVPFEIMCLADAVLKSEGKYRKAYLVLAGEGWTLKQFYLSTGLAAYLKNCETVEIVPLEGFVAKANEGKL